MRAPIVASLAVAAVLSSASVAGSAPGGDAHVTLGEQSVTAKLVWTCTRRQQRSRRGCPPQPFPAPHELGAPLRLGGSERLRIRLPVRARRILLNVGEYGEDYARVTAVEARPSSPGRRRWTAEQPSRYGPRTNCIAIMITTRKGTERTYFAAATAPG